MWKEIAQYLVPSVEFSTLLSYMFLNFKTSKTYASQVFKNETSALLERSQLKKEKDFWNVNIVPLVTLLFLSISTRYRTFYNCFYVSLERDKIRSWKWKEELLDSGWVPFLSELLSQIRFNLDWTFQQHIEKWGCCDHSHVSVLHTISLMN